MTIHHFMVPLDCYFALSNLKSEGKEGLASPTTQRKVYWDHYHTSSIRMMKVALWPCSMTSFPSEVRMCNPRGAFPGHFSILAMYLSRRPSVQLLDTILRYLGNSDKRTLGSDRGRKSSFVLFLFCLSTLMHLFVQRLTPCTIPSRKGRLKETQCFIM